MASLIHELVDARDEATLRTVLADHNSHRYIDEPGEAGYTALYGVMMVTEPDLNIGRLLLENGANPNAKWCGSPLIADVQTRQAALLLMEFGADPADLSIESKHIFLGFEEDVELPEVFPKSYLFGQQASFGRTNPENVVSPYREAMIRSGAQAYEAKRHFREEWKSNPVEPVWCMHRFGQSLTIMPDSRIILIAGEHEDSYDPDFCIYNDVIVIHPDKKIEIFDYPREVFPPTDFHTATLVGDLIYIIGSLGYRGERPAGRAQVCVLDTRSYMIQPISTKGDDPGRIFNHRAKLADGRIQVSGGKVIKEMNGEEQFEESQETFWLHLATNEWS